MAGTWLPEDTVYVSGRTGGPADADGVWVVTPVAVDGGDAALLVVRGWAADPASAPAAPTGRATWSGCCSPATRSTEVDADPADDVLPALRVTDVAPAPRRRPLRRVRRRAPTRRPGLAAATVEQLPPAGRFTALRNLLYALEWWVFGAFAAFIWWRHVRDQLAAEALAGSAEADAVPSEP